MKTKIVRLDKVELQPPRFLPPKKTKTEIVEFRTVYTESVAYFDGFRVSFAEEYWPRLDEYECFGWDEALYLDADIPIDPSIDLDSLEYEDEVCEGVCYLHRIEDDGDSRNVSTAEDWYAYYTSDDFRRKVDDCTILAALWAINREAKRLGERSQDAWQSSQKRYAGELSALKDQLYQLKSQVIAHAVQDGLLPDEVDDIETIEAKPKDTSEPGLLQAIEVCEAYLDGREVLEQD